ncbi:DoxX family membrane protein [Halosimplex litoreum]|uniref:DoxX family membrane protein n=1 Tax=Halosimplex litoreum TaxID=1198301 RepID=A0A7T3FX29_9EURY|nr:DoxX family membrane protein [Halosimplex litoreum]QPV62374.1 DoxX family membrane protein [Halosimplex litoreum]
MDIRRRLVDAETVDRLVDRTPAPLSVARVGLGAMVLLAGVHKLFAPGVWATYVTDWLAPWLVVSPVAFMLINGVLEVGFGAAIVADRATAVAAGVAAVSLSGTTAYLAVAAVVEGGFFVDVFVRDVGLSALAWAVLVDALRRSRR